MGPPSTSYEVLQDIRSSIEASLARILAAKKERQIGQELRELITEASVKFVELRQVNRSLLQEEDRVKSETESFKAPLDQVTLQLHNLLYEKNYYMKAINTCKDFKSKYPDIQLVSEEEFFKDAPVELREDPRLREDSHKLMMQRLQFELHQRKQLCEQRERIEVRKKMLHEKLAGYKKLLSSLPSHLKTVKRASLQVQQQLGLLHMKRMKQHQLAELLPPPLYILYSQLVIEKEASGENIDVEIIGSVKEAQAVARQMMCREAACGGDEPRGDEDAADEEDDSQRRRKRAKRAHEKDTADGEGIYNAHPLVLLLHLYYDQRMWSEKQNKPITLRFEYLQRLNVVCAGIENFQVGDHQSSWLANLFPDDLGLDLSNQLSPAQCLTLEKRRPTRPYKWAQQITGMDFLGEITAHKSRPLDQHEGSRYAALSAGLVSYRQQHRIQNILQALLHRRKALVALKEQLDSLFKLKVPAVKLSDVPWAQQKWKCGLRSWTEVQHDCERAAGVGPARESGDVVDVSVVGGEIEGGREDGELPPGLGIGDSYQTRDVSAFKASPTKDKGMSKQMDVDASSPLEPNRASRRAGASKPGVTGDQTDNKVVSQDAVYERLDSSKLTSAHRKEVAKSREPAKNKGGWGNNGERDFRAVLRRDASGTGRHLQLEAQVTISVQYPSMKPTFRLTWLSSDGTNRESLDDLQDWEAKVNECKGFPAEVGNNVLPLQLALLCKLFDDYMDRRLTRTGGQPTSVADHSANKH